MVNLHGLGALYNHSKLIIMETNHEKIQKHVRNFSLIYYSIWALGIITFIYFLTNIGKTPLILLFVVALIYAAVGVIDESKMEVLVNENQTK